MIALLLRTSEAHWVELSSLLLTYERCFQECARFDAYRTDVTRLEDRAEVIDVNTRLTALREAVDAEIDRLTVERCAIDLVKKQRRAGLMAALA